MNLYFIFPYRGVGGVSIQFLRFAEFLTANNSANCFLIDYLDGYMARNVQSKGVRVLYYDDDNKVNIPSGSVAIFQSITPWSIFPNLKIDKDVKLLFWNHHPFNLVPLLPGIRRKMQNNLLLSKLILNTILFAHYSKIKRFINVIISSRGLVFMDETNVKTTENFLDIKISEPIYVPVAVDYVSDLSNIKVVRRDLRKVLRVVWVGRVVDFKFYILSRTLQSLNSLQTKLGISFEVTVVGSGDYESQLKNEISKLDNLSCQFLSHVESENLDTFLLNNTDLLIAMGTSALEGAKLGIPTILLDFAYSPVSVDYSFKWLFERKGYTLGDLIDSSYFKKGNDSLELLIVELFSKYASICEKTQYYVMRHHEISSNAARLLDAARATKCTYGHLKALGLLDRGFLYSLFSSLRKRISLL
jgi:hypothetical protein